MIDPLRGLDDVPWATLAGAHGPSTGRWDVAAALRVLRDVREVDADARQDAYEVVLWGHVHHQGTLYEVTPHVVPFLVALVEAGCDLDGTIAEGLELFARAAPPGDLVCALVSGASRHGDEPFAAGRNDRVCAVAAAPSASGAARDHATLVESTLAGLLGNTGDRGDAIDLAVRARERPGAARFTRARVPALLRGANARLREHQARGAMRDLPAISAAILTTAFGRATVVSVGDGVAVHRLRGGRVERLTPPLPRIAPGIAVPRPQDLLGWTDDPDVHERDELLERGDIFVLCEWYGAFVPSELLAAMARAGSFEHALAIGFARVGTGALLIAQWR